jgi:hypothetical protein
MFFTSEDDDCELIFFTSDDLAEADWEEVAILLSELLVAAIRLSELLLAATELEVLPENDWLWAPATWVWRVPAAEPDWPCTATAALSLPLNEEEPLALTEALSDVAMEADCLDDAASEEDSLDDAASELEELELEDPLALVSENELEDPLALVSEKELLS